MAKDMERVLRVAGAAKHLLETENTQLRLSSHSCCRDTFRTPPSGAI